MLDFLETGGNRRARVASPRRRRRRAIRSIRTMPSRWPRCKARSRSCSAPSGASRESQIAGSNTRKSGHRLGWRQRIGLGNESLDQSGRDPATVFLPVRIAIFPDRDMNASLYRWLSAWFATVTVTTVEDHDPLRRDLLVLRRARETVAAVLARFPGLVQSYTALSAATASRETRPTAAPHRKGGGEDRARPPGCRGAARRRPLVRDNRREAAARASPCRISALPAMSVVGRLLDP